MKVFTGGCQIGMQGPLCPEPRQFCKLDTATSRKAFLDLNLHVLQLATIIEGALQYKIAPLTPPNVDRYTYMHIRPLPTFYDNLWNSHMGWSCHSYPKTRLLTRMYACIFSKTGYIYNFWHTSLLDRMSVYLALQGGSG